METRLNSGSNEVERFDHSVVYFSSSSNQFLKKEVIIGYQISGIFSKFPVSIQI